MAVFMEDQIIPVAILSVLWVSIDPKEHMPLSAMKVRQWVSQLLSRSILLGSSTDGVSMYVAIIFSNSVFHNVSACRHDIVRDFMLASHSSAELHMRQRVRITHTVCS